MKSATIAGAKAAQRTRQSASSLATDKNPAKDKGKAKDHSTSPPSGTKLQTPAPGSLPASVLKAGSTGAGGKGRPASAKQPPSGLSVSSKPSVSLPTSGHDPLGKRAPRGPRPAIETKTMPSPSSRRPQLPSLRLGDDSDPGDADELDDSPPPLETPPGARKTVFFDSKEAPTHVESSSSPLKDVKFGPGHRDDDDLLPADPRPARAPFDERVAERLIAWKAKAESAPWKLLEKASPEQPLQVTLDDEPLLAIKAEKVRTGGKGRSEVQQVTVRDVRGTERTVEFRLGRFLIGTPPGSRFLSVAEASQALRADDGLRLQDDDGGQPLEADFSHWHRAEGHAFLMMRARGDEDAARLRAMAEADLARARAGLLADVPGVPHDATDAHWQAIAALGEAARPARGGRSASRGGKPATPDLATLAEGTGSTELARLAGRAQKGDAQALKALQKLPKLAEIQGRRAAYKKFVLAQAQAEAAGLDSTGVKPGRRSYPVEFTGTRSVQLVSDDIATHQELAEAVARSRLAGQGPRSVTLGASAARAQLNGTDPVDGVPHVQTSTPEQVSLDRNISEMPSCQKTWVGDRHWHYQLAHQQVGIRLEPEPLPKTAPVAAHDGTSGTASTTSSSTVPSRTPRIAWPQGKHLPTLASDLTKSHPHFLPQLKAGEPAPGFDGAYFGGWVRGANGTLCAALIAREDTDALKENAWIKASRDGGQIELTAMDKAPEAARQTHQSARTQLQGINTKVWPRGTSLYLVDAEVLVAESERDLPPVLTGDTVKVGEHASTFLAWRRLPNGTLCCALQGQARKETQALEPLAGAKAPRPSGSGAWRSLAAVNSTPAGKEARATLDAAIKSLPMHALESSEPALLVPWSAIADRFSIADAIDQPKARTSRAPRAVMRGLRDLVRGFGEELQGT